MFSTVLTVTLNSAVLLLLLRRKVGTVGTLVSRSIGIQNLNGISGNGGCVLGNKWGYRKGYAWDLRINSTHYQRLCSYWVERVSSCWDV